MSRVEEAMWSVPRREFLPDALQDDADLDLPLSIGHGVTNSQPTTVRTMLDLLDPAEGDRVLDVGAGSGWTSALLAWLVAPSGSVVAVERVPDLVARLYELELPDVQVHQAYPHVLGWPERAPYDRILVSAEATQLPEDLVAQLAVGGVMVIPVNGVMLRVTRTGAEATIERHGRFRFVPLVEG